MKFDEVYDFISKDPVGTKLTKLELALYYLSEMYNNRYRELRMAEINGLATADKWDELPIESLYKDTVDFTRDDIIEFLVSEGSKLQR